MEFSWFRSNVQLFLTSKSFSWEERIPSFRITCVFCNNFQLLYTMLLQAHLTCAQKPLMRNCSRTHTNPTLSICSRGIHFVPVQFRRLLPGLQVRQFSPAGRARLICSTVVEVQAEVMASGVNARHIHAPLMTTRTLLPMHIPRRLFPVHHVFCVTS